MNSHFIIKNVKIIDSSNKFNQHKVDIEIKDKKIHKIDSKITSTQAVEYDFSDYYISRGWIDLHVHCFENITDISVEADTIGYKQGVTLICDAGSSGASNINKLYEISKQKKTNIKSFINIALTGLENRHELKDKNNINLEKTLQKIEEFNDFVVGIKLRASSSVMGEDTVTPFIEAKKIKKKTNLPMMVHVGNAPPSLSHVLNLMDENDILTHCFHGKPSSLYRGITLKEFLNNRNRNIYFDVGHGQDSFSYEIAKKAFEDNFLADSFSSDLHKYNVNGPVFSLSNVITKFYNLGYGLNECIERVTTNPAKMINLYDFGKIEESNIANLTIFKIIDIKKTLIDSQGLNIDINKEVVPYFCILNGKLERTIF